MDDPPHDIIKGNRPFSLRKEVAIVAVKKEFVVPMDSLTNDDRQALRAYLQRTEVRLSTLHRIAVSFMNGAGLLILLPVLLRDTIREINHLVLGRLLPQIMAYFHFSAETVTLPTSIFLLYLLLFIPFAISIILPLYALAQLFKDIVQFYFVGHTPGFHNRPYIPRLSLHAPTFSPDESPRAKRAILQREYNPEFGALAIPFNKERSKGYDELWEQTNGQLLPDRRKLEYLIAEGAFIGPIVGKENELNRLSTAFAIAGSTDDDLLDEATLMELTIVRHVVGIRRIILRYIKSLILLVSTMLITFTVTAIISTILQIETPYQDQFILLILSFGYFTWALLTHYLIRLPMNWVLDLVTESENKVVDRHLNKLELRLIPLLRLAALISLVVALITATLFFL